MIKKPLVLTDGEIEQLQTDDTLSSAPNSLSLDNGGSQILPPGSPVRISASNECKRATALDKPNAIGFATEEIAIGATGAIQTDGKLAATTAEWDYLTGQTGGLTPGATYYLDDNGIGKLTVTPPTTQGNFLVRLGIAINPTDLEIKISRPIRL